MYLTPPPVRRQLCRRILLITALILVVVVLEQSNPLSSACHKRSFGSCLFCGFCLRRTEMPRMRQGVHTALLRRALNCESELEVPDNVKKLGIRFASMPPGPVTINFTRAGSWAEQNGLRAGVEIEVVNGRNVTAMSEEEFKKIMKPPLHIRLSIDPRDLTTAMTYSTTAPQLLMMIRPWVGSMVFDDIHVAQSIYRLGVHSSSFVEDLERSPVLRRLVDRAQQLLQVGSFSSRQLANILWAIGKTPDRAECFQVLFPLFDRAFRDVVDGMNARDISNILWAFAALRGKAPELLDTVDAAIERAIAVAPAMDPQSVANNFKAAAKLADVSGDVYKLVPLLVDALARVAPRMLNLQIAAVIYAAGQLRLGDETLSRIFDALLPTASANLASFTPQQLSNICMGMAFCGVPDNGFLKNAAQRVIAESSRWDRRARRMHIPQVLCALALIQIRHDELLKLVASFTDQDFQGLTDWNLCAIRWSFGKLGAGSRLRGVIQRLDGIISSRRLPKELVDAAPVAPEVWYRMSTKVS